MDISVIIATRNRAESLRRTLQCLVSQETQGLHWEVIVTDNGSTDETSEVLKQFADTLALVALSEPRTGKNLAVNRAVDAAKGNLLVFTDDDVVTGPNWIESWHEAVVRWPEDAIFGGFIEPQFPAETANWIRDPSFRFAGLAFARFDPASQEGPIPQSPSHGNLAVRREMLDGLRFNPAIGPAGSDYVMGGETELLDRLRNSGQRFIYVPSAKLEHVIRPDQLSLDWLSGRAYRGGRGSVRSRPDRYKSPKALLGVPGRVWLRFILSCVKLPVAYFLPERIRSASIMEFHFMRGRRDECRRLARERASGQNSVSA